ncbi:MAG: archaellin/type IV pilin N-terminal domain-containing protein [Promethearchaeota archaeon]
MITGLNVIKRAKRTRKALSPVVGTMILVGVTISASVLISFYYREVAFANTNYITLEFQSAYFAKPVSINNARWEIIFTLYNTGTQSIEIQNISVNSRPVNEYDLAPGDSLSSGTVIGTSLPKSGITLESGETTTQHLWIGSGLFSSGTSIELKIENINNVGVSRVVILI